MRAGPVTCDDGGLSSDGCSWPAHRLRGRGLPGGGFYFAAGAFALPTHGNPAQSTITSPRRPGSNLRSVYRVLLGDAMSYESGIRFAIEHGPTNDVPADFSSVVFHYVRPPVLVETDRFDVEIDARDSPAPWTAFSYAASSRLE